MKKVLITGANSYVGTSLEAWLNKYYENYSVDTIDMKNESWKEQNFSGYDSVVHVAGIAHIKETKKNADMYYKINRDLAYAAAQKAKNESVKQFIFLSSMSIYGMERGFIFKDTAARPAGNYAKSKFDAENLITLLNDENFKIAILRPPMIYGKGCKGNYPKLSKLAKKIPVFPDINNKRSMIYINNLCEFIRILIDDGAKGIYFPQNKEYVSTTELVKLISQIHKKNIKFTKLFNPIIRIFKISVVNKIFGDLVYDKSISEYNKNYIVSDFISSIEETEKN